MADRRTIGVYDAEASRYGRSTQEVRPYPLLDSFINALPAGGHVLDLGCGPGTWAAYMVARGLRVDALDASPGMVKEARARHGLTARLGGFDAVRGTEIYDGIWAHYSLLHAPRAAFPGHLEALHRALKPGGRMLLMLKAGSGEGRDLLGRFYCYHSEPELRLDLEAAGFGILHCETGADTGFDGTAHDWIAVTARRP